MDPGGNGKCRLLLVENHTVFAEAVTEQFLGDYDVEHVTSLRAALAAIKANRPYDFILVDYDLDDGKGDALIAEVRSLAPSTMVVAISARETGNQRLRAAGAIATCAKLDFAQVDELLKRLLLLRFPGPR